MNDTNKASLKSLLDVLEASAPNSELTRLMLAHRERLEEEPDIHFCHDGPMAPCGELATHKSDGEHVCEHHYSLRQRAEPF